MSKATAALQGLSSLPNQSQEYCCSCWVSDYFVKKYSHNPSQEELSPAIQSITCSSISEILYNVIMLVAIIWTGISICLCCKNWSLLVDCRLMLPGTFLTLCSFVPLGSSWRIILFKHVWKTIGHLSVAADTSELCLLAIWGVWESCSLGRLQRSIYLAHHQCL